MKFKRSYFLFSFFTALNIMGFIALYGMINYTPPPILIEKEVGIENREGYETKLSLTSPLEIEFSHELSNVVDASKAFKIFPNIKGKWNWKNKKTVLFEPEEDWPTSFQGLFEVTEIQKIHSQLLLKPCRLPFKMKDFELINCFQKDSNGAGQNEIKIGLEFNAKIDPQQLNKYLKIKSKTKNEIPFSIINQEPSKRVEIYIESEFETKIDLIIDKELRPLNGASLSSKVEKSISCSYFYRVNFVKPQFNENIPYIQVATNKREKIKDLIKSIKISPAVFFSIVNEWDGFEIHGAFKGNTEYTVLIDKSLSGFTSKNAITEEFKIKFSHLPAYLEYAENETIYGLYGNQNIEMTSTNVDHINATIYQIPNYNYNLFLKVSDYRQSIFSEKLNTLNKAIPYVLDQNIKWSINMKELLPKIAPGFYELEVRVKNEQFLEDRYSEYRSYSKKIIITDIGVSCRKTNNGLFFWINRLSDLTPIHKAEIKLFTGSNTLLLEAKTEENGFADLKIDKKILDKIEFALIQFNNDVTYLKFQENIRNYVSEGSEYSSASYQTFISLERNVFRPGEKIEIDGVIRDHASETPPPFPVEISIKTIDDKSIFTKSIKPDSHGSFHFAYQVSETMAGGQYSIFVSLADKTIIGHESFEIRSFFPQRLNGKLESLNTKIPVKEPLEFELHCEYLTGASAEGLIVDSHIQIKEMPTIVLDNLPGFKIGYSPKILYQEFKYLPKQELDKDSKLKFQYVVPELENTNAIYQLELFSSVLDAGGRTYSLWKSQKYFPRSQLIAIKSNGIDGDKRKFAIQCIDSNGELLAINTELDWTLINVNPRWTLVKKNNYYMYEYSEEGVELLAGKLKTNNGAGELEVPLLLKDRQELIIKSNDGIKSNIFANETSLAMPKNPYEISFEKIPSIKPGEEFSINITVPFLGKGLLCTETNEIQTHQIVSFDQKKMSIPLRVPENARGSIHLSCTLLQSQKDLGEVRSYRASGACQIVLNHQNKQLNIVAKPPIQSNSATEIPFVCSVSDYEGKPVKNARVLVSVMDKGIKNLAGVYAPNAFGFFYGPHSSTIKEFDFYKNVVYEKIKIVENMQPGGGGDDGSIRREKFVSFQDRIQLVRWQSDILEANDNGEVFCKVPGFEYQGKLDFQIWGLLGNQFGYATKEVLVRDEIVVEETFPKFLYASDKVLVPIVVQNLEDTPQKFNLNITCISLLTIKDFSPIELTLEPKGKKKIILECQAGEIEGVAPIEIQWTIGEKKITKSIKLPIVSRKSIVTLFSEGLINNNDKNAITNNNILENTSKNAELLISASPFEQLRGSLDYLISYPYGCGEQTISKLLPLVYSRPLLEMTNKISSQKEIDFYLSEGINKLQRYQNSKGGIRLWEHNSSADIFVSAYACFLFSQLIKTGVAIDKSRLSSLVSYLKNTLKENTFVDVKSKCFILYSLALHGEFQKVLLNDLILNHPKLDRSSACFLYMAAILTGVTMPKWEEFSKESEYYRDVDSSGFYGSFERDMAVELLMASDFDLKINAEALALNLLAQRNQYGYWSSSQTNSWSYFALMKYLQSYSTLEKPEWSCELWAGDQKWQGTNEKALKINQVDSAKILIQKQGRGLLYYRLMEKGFAKNENYEKMVSGIHIEKEILSTKERQVVDEQKLEDRNSYLIKLTIKSDIDMENVVIQDFFPAGMEYSNEEDIEIAKGVRDLQLLSSDVKDDRMYLFPVKLDAQIVYEYYYSVRTTIPGDFFFPACKIEGMYNASKFGKSKARIIQVRSNK